MAQRDVILTPLRYTDSCGLLFEDPAVLLIHDKRLFDLMKDFGTSKSTKIDSIFDSLLVPRPSR
ncbi:MAG: hypothetical protein ABW068_06770, partial [Candidatus Thiodiazotropha sp.]